MARIVFIKPKTPTPEEKAAGAFLKSFYGDMGILLSISQLRNFKWSGDDILWFHSDRDPEELTQLANALKLCLGNILHQNVHLFFTLSATWLPEKIGLENVPLNHCVRTFWSEDVNEYTIRGLFGGAEHPLFKPFHGGVFTWRPVKGESFVVYGYSNDSYPEQFRIIGVERIHIGMNENLRCVWERIINRSRILCIGGYLFFTMKDRLFEKERNAFVQQCFSYLRETPWQEKSPNLFGLKKTGLTFKQSLTVEPADFQLPQETGESWKDALMVSHPANQFWDLSGRKTLAMGRIGEGIDEIWFHPFRAVKQFAFCFKDQSEWLLTRNCASRAEIFPDRLQRRYAHPLGELVEQIRCGFRSALVQVKFLWRGLTPVYLHFRFYADLVLMWPYPPSVTGSIKASSGSTSLVLANEQDFHLLFCANREFRRLTVHDCSVSTGSLAEIRGSLKVSPGQSVMLFFFGQVCRAEEFTRHVQNAVETLPAEIAEHKRFLEHLSSTTDVKLANKEIEGALNICKRNLASFFAETDQTGAGLLAGFGRAFPGWFQSRPGYAWFFARDAAWCGVVLLTLGRYKEVRAILEHMIRFQHFNGKIYHEVTTSGVVHYDAADSTPLFIWLMEQYFCSTGDWSFLQSSWLSVKRAFHFCLSTDSDGDGFIENTNVGHGWIEGGPLYGAHVTLYLAALWIAALRSFLRMAKAMNDSENERRSAQILNRVEVDFDKKFYDPEKGFYAYGLDRRGRKRSVLTVMAAMPAVFGVGRPDHRIQSLNKLNTPEFLTDWGARMLSCLHPDYHPRSYHSGSVWPLFTGWLSVADFKVGKALSGYANWLRQIPLLQDITPGKMPEVLRGDRYQFSGICEHQAWSDTMVLWPFFAGILGLQPDVPDNKLRMTPQIPWHWPRLSVHNLLFGTNPLDFEYSRSGLQLTFRIRFHREEPVELEMILPFATKMSCKRVEVDKSKRVRLKVDNEPLSIKCQFTSTITIHVEMKYILAFVPEWVKPRYGDVSRGYSIVKENHFPGEYRVVLSGRAGSRHTAQLLALGVHISDVVNADLLQQEGDWVTLAFQFPETGETFPQVQIRIAYCL